MAIVLLSSVLLKTSVVEGHLIVIWVGQRSGHVDIQLHIAELWPHQTYRDTANSISVLWCLAVCPVFLSYVYDPSFAETARTENGEPDKT